MKARPLRVLFVLILLTHCRGPAVSPTPEAGWGDPIQEQIQRVENGLVAVTAEGQIEAGQPKALADSMQRYGVPGVSIAVIRNYEIEWAKGYGVLEVGAAEPVTPDTLFNAGSILKPVCAAAALALVEKGVLGLDEDINQELLSWQVPQNQYTVTEKVTLRRLLSHSAGLTDGFTNRGPTDPVPAYVVSAGEVPAVTIQQMLDAEVGVDVDGPTRVASAPGTKYAYANADYAILNLLLHDVTGKALPAFMAETILAPLEMESSTFEQPLPENLRARASTEHYANGQPFADKRQHYPIGGLWTTPSDLARFAIELMLAYKGQSSKILSQQMAQEMLTPQIQTPGEMLGESYGVGFHLAGQGPDLRFVHTGATWGSTCILWAYPEMGDGAVIMTNSASAQGIILFEVLLSIAAEYGWALAR